MTPKTSRTPRTTFDIRPVTADMWEELAAFFGRSGAYSNCWCVWWRVSGQEFSAGCADQGAGNRELMHGLVAEGRTPGLLAFPPGGDTPAGWVSVAPRPEFGRIVRSRLLKPGPDEDRDDASVWAVTCFWIPRRGRGQGIGGALLAGAVSYAAERGAAAIEGYPVDTGGAKAAASSLYTGTVSMFERAGFTEVRRRSDRRPVMRLRLGGKG